MKKLLIALLLLTGFAFAQQGQDVAPILLNGATLPGQCNVNQLFILKGTGAGLYWCNGATNTFNGPLAVGNASGIVLGANGGTGVANTGDTITLAGNLTTTGAFNTTIAQQASTTVTLPTTSSTMARTDAAQTFTGVQTFVAPILGTPTSVDLTNGTNVPVSSPLSGSLLPAANGGTGVNNGTSTVTLAGNLTTTGAFNTTFAQSGTATVTLPTTSSTMARTDAAQTYTGASTTTAWNMNNPVVVGPAGTACGSTCSPTAGQLKFFNLAGGSTATLPTSSGSGSVIRFRITVADSSAQEKVLLTTTSDVIIGTAIGENAGTAKVFIGSAITAHSIQMPFAGTQPSGGFVGDQITCTDIATGTWACDIIYQAGLTPTTPYSTSTT